VSHSRRNSLILSLALFILFVFAGTARAQQPPPNPPPPPPTQEGSAEFAYVGTSGNSSTSTLGVRGEYVYRPSPWEFRAKAAYVHNETDSELKAESLLFTFRAQREIKPRLAAFSEYGYSRDRFAGILNRNTIEGGLLYTWVDHAPHKLVVDGALGYAHEDRLVGENLSEATAATGAVYTLKISENSEFSEDGHFVFSLNTGENWRYANLLALTAKMTTIFSLKVSNAVRYVNQPVEGFKTTDVITSVALVAKF
jgi:putative salt-induced outer membrane protein YdiY